MGVVVERRNDGIRVLVSGVDVDGFDGTERDGNLEGNCVISKLGSLGVPGIIFSLLLFLFAKTKKYKAVEIAAKIMIVKKIIMQQRKRRHPNFRSRVTDSIDLTDV